MKKAALVLILPALLSVRAGADTKYPVEEQETIRKTLKLQDASRPASVSLDNVFGSITVEAAENGLVEITARKTIRARSKDKVQQAKDEVKLEVSEKAGAIEVYVDGPFRCRCGDGGRGLKDRDLGYEVLYDFVLKVPRRTGLVLMTVNDGDILVRGVEGAFDVRNVNGRVELAEAAGSGSATTVNGGVKVRFDRNPSADCRFLTINGDVELEFREGLSADFMLKTFNGKAFSDFETTTLPIEVREVKDTEEGRYHYHAERATRVRAAKGGPVVECDTLNGDIFIKKSKAK